MIDWSYWRAATWGENVTMTSEEFDALAIALRKMLSAKSGMIILKDYKGMYYHCLDPNDELYAVGVGEELITIVNGNVTIDITRKEGKRNWIMDVR